MYLVAGASGAALDAPAVQIPADDPDALYKDRENQAGARKATDIWTARLTANPQDFTSAYRLAQARYWLGTNGLPEPQRKGALEAGIAAARAAIAIDANRPEGHFWLAANMGALAESFGLRQGIKYRSQIRNALEKSLKLDPAFLQGSADRAIGRWYFKVPGLFGGSNRKSEEHLRKALTYNPRSVISHIFLADTLADMGRTDEARKEYQAAIDAPPDPDWIPEDRRFKEQAKQILQRLSRRGP
ncbi:MAG: TRAP transporter TatT component family protein [Vicinamibacterales bacterium]